MTLFEITHGEQATWQRRAAMELTAILQAHRDLPIIAWTIGTAGSSLVGRVNGLARAGQVRTTFEAWRLALGLTEQSEVTSSGGAVYLRAVAHRNRVQVGLTATVLDEED
jgi:hypothetical protein